MLPHATFNSRHREGGVSRQDTFLRYNQVQRATQPEVNPVKESGRFSKTASASAPTASEGDSAHRGEHQLQHSINERTAPICM